MRTKWLLGLALVTAVGASYLPALQAGFVWNDDTYLTENRTLDGIEGLRLIWTEPKANEQYYPMVFTSFWVEKHLWSLQPFGYHLVNVLLHAGSALLLWGLLVRLGLPGAWFAAACSPCTPWASSPSPGSPSARTRSRSSFLSSRSTHGIRFSRRARKPPNRRRRGALCGRQSRGRGRRRPSMPSPSPVSPSPSSRRRRPASSPPCSSVSPGGVRGARGSLSRATCGRSSLSSPSARF